MSHSKAYETFQKNIESADILSVVYNSYENKGFVDSCPDYKELLRGEYVLLVSAFETYFHHLIFEKLKNDVDFYKSLEENNDNVSIAMSALCKMLGFTDNANTKYQSAQKDLSKVTIQKLKKIAVVLSERLDIADFQKKFMNASIGNDEDFENAISEIISDIINRRHQIAHESDIIEATGKKREIDNGTIIGAKDLLGYVVNVIDCNIDDWIIEAKSNQQQIKV
jgi:hypothetical protein